MDFAQYNLREASERGSWVHLEGLDGSPLFDGDKPCRVRLKGVGSPDVLEAYRALERAEIVYERRIAAATQKSQYDSLVAGYQVEVDNLYSQLIIAAVAEIDNIELRGKPVKSGTIDVLEIVGPVTIFFAQIKTALGEHGRLFFLPDER